MKLGYNSHDRLAGFASLATFVLVVAMLRVAQEVFIPIALTVMLTFLLTPMVVFLTRWKFPRTVAILLTVTVAFSVIGAVGWVVATQAVSLAKSLPDYEYNLHSKIRAFKSPHIPGTLERTTGFVKKLQEDLQAPAPKDPSLPAASQPASSAPPVPVEIRPPESTPLEFARQVLGPLLSPLGTAAIVIVFVIAMLFQREDLRDRFINVVSAGRLNLATQALDDASRRVSRYLFMQLVVNATYGVPIGVGLYLIGIPNALLWGLLATLLRFIPFLGPWIAAAFPLVLALAVDPGWDKFFYTLGLFLAMELVSNNIIEVILYGASTGISNLALMVAAVFWTWLWGPIGLFLSTPLTVCIMVVGKYVPVLKNFSILLGSEPVTDPPSRFYQRMLARDSQEMLELAETYVAAHSIEAFYSDVFVPALILSEEDRHNGDLAEVRQKFIFESSRELIEELERRGETRPGEKNGEEGKLKAEPAVPPENALARFDAAPVTVLGVSARDDADELVGLMLQHLLRLRGIEAEIVPTATHPDDTVASIDRPGIKAVFISALPPAALVGTRQLCRRLKIHRASIPLLVGVWSREAQVSDLRLRLRGALPDEIVTSVGDAVQRIEKLLAPPEKRTETNAPSPAPKNPVKDIPALSASEPLPEEPAPKLSLREGQNGDWLEVLKRDIAQRFEVPVGLVTIFTVDREFWKLHGGLPSEIAKSPEPTATTLLLNPDELLMIEDVSKDRRFANNALITERGVRFYASVPLRPDGKHVVGNVCVVDTKPRKVSDADRNFLEQRAAELMEAISNGSEADSPAETPA